MSQKILPASSITGRGEFRQSTSKDGHEELNLARFSFLKSWKYRNINHESSCDKDVNMYHIQNYYIMIPAVKHQISKIRAHN